MYSYAYDGVSTTWTDNRFVGNTAGHGGAVRADLYIGDHSFTGNRFEGNTSSANYGGGLLVNNQNARLTLAENRFEDNESGSHGGGARVTGSGSASTTLTANRFIRNRCTSSSGDDSGGGGLLITGARGNPEDPLPAATFIGNTFIGNRCGAAGGGLRIGGYPGYSIWESLVLSGNLFSDNRSGQAGGGLYLRLDSAEIATLTNNSFAGNLAGDPGLNVGGGIAAVLEDEESVALSLHNNLFWDNSASAGEGADLHLANDGDGDGTPASVTLMNNDFDQSAVGFYADVAFAIDTSNLDAVDPMFVDAAGDDLHLQAGSPVIDRGDDTAPELPATDIDGEARIAGAAVDIGADETSAAPDCDRNQDGTFNVRDIVQFYRSCSGGCSPVEIKGFIRDCRTQ